MRRIPWRRSNVETMRRSFWPSGGTLVAAEETTHEEEVHTASLPKKPFQTGNKSYCNYPSQHILNYKFVPWFLPFHSNPSCNLKNSLNAGSSFNDANSFVCCSET